MKNDSDNEPGPFTKVIDRRSSLTLARFVRHDMVDEPLSALCLTAQEGIDLLDGKPISISRERLNTKDSDQ